MGKVGKLFWKMMNFVVKFIKLGMLVLVMFLVINRVLVRGKF